MTPDHQYHIPVLLGPTIELLAPKSGERYLDMTAGYGGHASKVLELIGQKGRALLIDRDEQAIATLEDRFGRDERVERQRSDFVSAARALVEARQSFDMILIDLGLSSPQIDQAERGFSFRLDGPLDMRMDRSQGLSAQQIVNSYPERQLVDILYRYGEEPQARRIARAIIATRPIGTTRQLAKIIEQANSRRSGKIHPATRTFQALRIVINDELAQIEAVLPLATELLATGGRLAVITFHSLEDRIVKHFLKDRSGPAYDAELQLLSKKPIQGKNTDVFNPRARSAKLRAVVKINTPPASLQEKTERG